MNGSHVRFQKWLFKILVEIIYLQSSSWPAEQAMIKMDKAWFCLVNYVVFDWGFPTLCLSMLYLDSDEWWWMYLKIDTTRYYLMEVALIIQRLPLRPTFSPSSPTALPWTTHQKRPKCPNPSQPHDTQNPSPTASEIPHCTYLQTNFSGTINLRTNVVCSK